MDFWRNVNILNPNQFAYMEGRSTLSELLSCYDSWAKSRNNRKSTDIAFLDFSKALDSVPHERLLFKLERHGIDGALQWFRHFLTGRTPRFSDDNIECYSILSNALEGEYKTWNKLFNPGLALIGLSRTGFLKETRLKPKAKVAKFKVWYLTLLSSNCDA